MAGVKGRSGGHNRRSIAQHRLAGTLRQDRTGGFQDAAAPRGRPEPPKPLHGDALAEWDRMIRRLEPAGVLSLLDDAALYQHCQLFAETEALVDWRDELARLMSRLETHLHGLTDAELAEGTRAIGTIDTLRRKVGNQVRQGRMAQRVFLGEFGLTPTTRTRAHHADPPVTTDEWGDALER